MPENPPLASAETTEIRDEKAFLAFHDLTPDGFMMFRPVRSEAGVIDDFEWTFVNKAAGQIVGRPTQDLLGKHLLVEMPGNRDEGLFDAYVKVVETGETWQQEFHYDHGGISAWFRTTAAALEGNLAVSFADISEVKRGDERLRKLIDSMIAFVGVLSPEGILLEANEPAVAAAGVDRNALIGRPFWDCYWWSFDAASQARLKEAVAKAATGESVRYDVEIRVAGDARIWIDFQIVPVFDAQNQLIELIPSGVDITERKRIEAQKELLISELSHRVKNTLAIIQSIANQSTRSAATMEDFRSSFMARLQAIAACHDLLVRSDHHAVSLEALVLSQIRPFAANTDSMSVNGPNVTVPGDVAYSLGLVLHELATNASKYGALSTDAGKVLVNWNIAAVSGGQQLHLTWEEAGGPYVDPPESQGFGTRLIEHTLASLGGDSAKISFSHTGVVCELKMLL